MARIIPGTSAIVDPACPHNWDHPLNYGLVADWTVVPNSGWRGGVTLRDLVRGGRNPHPGTLVSSPVWGGSAGCPGAFGALSFNGTSSYVSVPTLTALFGTKATCALWVKLRAQTPASASKTGVAFDDEPFGGAATHYPYTDGNVYLAIFDTGRPIGGYADGGFDKTKWHHFVITSSPGAGNYKFYRNGSLVTTGTGPASIYFPAGCHIGGNSNQSIFCDGWQTGHQLYNRDLSAAQVKALYLETRAGSPERFNWIDAGLRFISIPQGVTGNRRRRVLCAGRTA